MSSRQVHDRGQAVVLVVAVVVVTVVCAVGAARLGAGVLLRHRAQAAADAAALAGAAGGRDAAARAAEANGARLRSFVMLPTHVGSSGGDVVEVVVMLDGQMAVTRAARAP